MEKQTYAVGDRVEKLCAVCGEERGHVVATTTKLGQISRVDCPKCSTRSLFKRSTKLTGGRASAKVCAPYDRTHKYAKGEMLTHPSFGVGEVTALIEPQKIGVLFPDRIRTLIHESLRA
jgi:DNA-directed RNA polymerase subunit RPC12/RpoP